ncbi:MAG: asparagine synthetase B [Flavobacteriaceae bacterium]|nr:MAG: asparagine synthetase B [Flavobacteriaceae bacterium]
MKNLLTLTIIAVTMMFSSEVVAQNFSGLDKSPADIALYPSRAADKIVKVVYSRPQLKGRSLSDLAPAGKVWRTGANEATEITFFKDVNFAGKSVKAGTYSLFTIPSSGEWTIILNSNLNQWGAYSYADSADVARVTASASTDGKSLEAFSIAYKEIDGGANMVLGWGTTRVTVPITL